MAKRRSAAAAKASGGTPPRALFFMHTSIESVSHLEWHRPVQEGDGLLLPQFPMLGIGMQSRKVARRAACKEKSPAGAGLRIRENQATSFVLA
jgi:hypothetical protein